MPEKRTTKLYLRVCPMEKMVWDDVKVLNDKKSVYVRCPQSLEKGKSDVPTFWTFQSEHVFFQESQKEIYDVVIPEILECVTQVSDAMVVAYGQTGTGKSMTISGTYNSYEARGILPRVATDLFHNVKTQLRIQVSYLEFTKTHINDLMRPYPNQLQYPKNVTKVTVKSVEDVFKIIFTGEGRKQFSKNASYPSHSYSTIFTFHIDTKNVSTRRCKILFVDLAGTNTVGNSSCLFKRPYEVAAANLAKSQLEQFFLVLAANVPDQIKVKLRLNPMIRFVEDSLNPGTVLRAIGHIRVTREDLLVTLSMLRFGELFGGIKIGKFKVQTEEETQKRVDNLQKELSKLRMESRYNSLVSNQNLGKSVNEERFAHIERTVNEYLQNKISELSLVSVCDIHIALDILKNICKKVGDKPKESSPSVTKIKRTPSSQQKVVQKSSMSSNKTTSTEPLVRTSSDKPHPVRAGSTELRTTSRRPKTSSSSVTRRSSLGRRKSRSNGSVRDRSEDSLKPLVPPEYPDAWSAFTAERNDEYSQLLASYKTNEASAKNAYKTYLQEVRRLEDVVARVEKYKTNLFLAKMTRDFNRANKCESGTVVVNDYEACCTKELQKAEQERRDKQELVLRCQSELKAYVNVCKEEKRLLTEKFGEFCKGKYQVPVALVEPSEIAEMTLEEALVEDGEEEEPVQVEDTEGQVFERLKGLVQREQQRRRSYDMNHRQWLQF